MTSTFSLKRMDEEEAWRCNYQFVQQRYPKLGKAAFDFYLQKVNRVIRAIPKDRRGEFAREYQMLHGILKKNLGYIAFSSQLALKHRVKLLLDYFTL